MNADLWTLAGLALMSALAWMWGYLRGHEVADAMWRNRMRENRRALIDAHRRLAVFEERERDRHEHRPLTRDEHEAFIAIAEAEEGDLP